MKAQSFQTQKVKLYPYNIQNCIHTIYLDNEKNPSYNIAYHKEEIAGKEESKNEIQN